MANQEALIAEYNTLRQEILQKEQMNIQFHAAALAVASAFVVYGFQAQNSLAFLAATAIPAAALYYSAFNTREIVKVGAYIYSIIEPKVDDLRWETIALAMRTRKNPASLGFSYKLVIPVFALLGISCLFFAWWFLKDYHIFNVVLYSGITFILGASFIIVSLYAYQGSSKKYHSDYVNQWKNLEKELYPTVTVIYRIKKPSINVRED